MIAAWARRLQLQAVCYHRMYMSEPDLVRSALTREDLPIYRERIEEAKRELEGGDVKLFDYLLVDQLQSSSEPLNSQESLVVIRSFQPKNDRFSGDLTQVIGRLKTQQIPLLLTSELVCSGEAIDEQRDPGDTPISADPAEADAGNRSLSDLEHLAASLRQEVLARAPDGLRIPYCLAPWYRLCVKADGRLIPCSRWSQSYGNFNNVQSFNQAWNGEFQRKLRRGFHGHDELQSACTKCTCIDRYQGMTELLRYLGSLGISYDDVPKQDGFNPPEGKLAL